MSALVFGMSSVAEQRSTQRVRRRRTLSPRLLLDLVRQRTWVAAIGATLVGFALQVVALRYGPLALVQPILVCDLIFAVMISAFLRRSWDPIMLAGVGLSAAGLSAFLVIARPSGGAAVVGAGVMLPLGLGLFALVTACILAGQWRPGTRPIALALACGISYGFAAFLVKLITAQFGEGMSAVLMHWPVYVLAVVGPLGFLLNQNAFQQGILLAPVMAIITACDPLISIALAHFLLHESLSSSPAAIAGQVLALLTMTGGIALIAHHSPQVISQIKAQSAATAQAAPDS